MTKRSRKQKSANVQGEYEEVFEPDSDIQLRVLALFGMFVAMALMLVAEVVMTDDTAMLVFGIVLAGTGIVIGAREVLQVYWNRCLAFAITPEKLTLLWNGQPVKVIPWGEVIEIFSSPGPCERNGRYSTYYGIYISLQYGYKSRLHKAKRQILNLHISPDSMRHLEKFPVMRICICGNRKSGQQLAQKIEGYRNAAWAQSYEARTK